MIIEGFEHFVGNHCSSSALKSVLAFDSVNLSEAMVFGLASGLGFFYINDSNEPSRKFNGRAPDLEGSFFKLIDHNLDWARVWDIEIIKRSLKNNRPIIAQTDIFPIPYYDNVHFIGHGLLIVGIEKEKLIVADIAATELLSMPIESFKKAVEKDYYPLLSAYSYAPVPVVKSIEIEALLPRAIKKTCLYMLEPPSIKEGLAGLQLMSQEIPYWHKQEDASFIARFGYQAIEKRGTGGGSFRKMFAEFLHETRDISGINNSIIIGFEKSAKLWTTFAGQLKEAAFASQTRQAAIFAMSAEILSSIEILEENLFRELLNYAA